MHTSHHINVIPAEDFSK